MYSNIVYKICSCCRERKRGGKRKRKKERERERERGSERERERERETRKLHTYMRQRNLLFLKVNKNETIADIGIILFFSYRSPHQIFFYALLKITSIK